MPDLSAHFARKFPSKSIAGRRLLQMYVTLGPKRCWQLSGCGLRMHDMLKVVFAAFSLLTAAAIPQSAWSQDQDPPESVVDDVIVEGRRTLSETVHAFVDEMTEPPRGRGPARWHHRICVGAVNLQPAAAQTLVDRVSDVAGSVGLQIGEPGCQPNVLIIATNDANALADGLIESRPRAFRPAWSGGSRSAQALEAFRNSDRPVRWWHVSVPVNRDTGTVAVNLFGEGTPPPVIAGEGLLRTNVTNRLLRTFVILDIPRMQNMTFQQLGDYVAMIALAQIDPDADPTGYDSVLNLFGNPVEGLSLTAWDSAYLSSLYDAELRQKVVGSQLHEVSSRMLRNRRRSDTSPNEP